MSFKNLTSYFQNSCYRKLQIYKILAKAKLRVPAYLPEFTWKEELYKV